MFFAWFKKRRRRKILAEPFAPGWHAILRDQVRHYGLLADADQKKLRNAVQIILAEKDWEGCRGLELTDEIRVTVAALAGILILGFDDFYFDNVQTILVYPDAYVVTQESLIAGEATMTEESDVLGQSQRRGPVLLSWAEIRKNADRRPYGQNLVFHEFAHKLDMLNGAFDGTPNLPTRELQERWATIMDAEYRRLQWAARRGRRTLLDKYGAKDPAEFFAVATEFFFEVPRPLKAAHPQLYDLFRDYYRQDPAAWREFEQAPG